MDHAFFKNQSSDIFAKHLVRKHKRLDGKRFLRFVYFRSLKDVEVGDILTEKANI